MLLKNTKDLFIERNLDDDKKDLNLEKGDFTAMIIAAFITLMPALLLVFGLFALVIFLMFRR
ncbi:MAG TPA: hypothetical protein DC000_08805 [Clostridiales bacterium]|nr:hypothetical protein [Clostridiales bacterium]